MEEAESLPVSVRALCLRIEAASDFRLEYARNLSKGGCFVPTAESFELRELVEVRLEAPFANEVVRLRAEIVHQQPRDGVSVQFLAPASVVRVQLGPILERAIELTPAPPPPPVAPGEEETDLVSTDARSEFGWEESSEDIADDPNDRTHRARASRYPIRLGVWLKGPGGVRLAGHTRNASSSGLLIAAPGEALPVGAEVDVELLAPSLERPLEISARVVRRLEAPGVVPAVAVTMHPGPREQELALLVEDLAAAQVGFEGRAAPDELGPGGVVAALRCVARLARKATIAFESGAEEALVLVEEGYLVAARVGPVHGVKALGRILAWTEGSYEILDEPIALPDVEPMPIPIADAIERARKLLEAAVDATTFPADSRFAVRLGPEDPRRSVLSAVEVSVVALAKKGLTLRRILDFSPEPDGDLLRAIRSLVDRGLLSRV